MSKKSFTLRNTRLSKTIIWINLAYTILKLSNLKMTMEDLVQFILHLIAQKENYYHSNLWE